MTSPPSGGGGDQPAPTTTTSRPRVGAFVTFSIEDRFRPAQPDGSPGRYEGQGVVIRVADDGSNVVVAPLSDAHLQVAADAVTPIKPTDVQTSMPQPEPAE